MIILPVGQPARGWNQGTSGTKNFTDESGPVAGAETGLNSLPLPRLMGQ